METAYFSVDTLDVLPIVLLKIFIHELFEIITIRLVIAVTFVDVAEDALYVEPILCILRGEEVSSNRLIQRWIVTK